MTMLRGALQLDEALEMLYQLFECEVGELLGYVPEES